MGEPAKTDLGRKWGFILVAVYAVWITALIIAVRSNTKTAACAALALFLLIWLPASFASHRRNWLAALPWFLSVAAGLTALIFAVVFEYSEDDPTSDRRIIRAAHWLAVAVFGAAERVTSKILRQREQRNFDELLQQRAAAKPVRPVMRGPTGTTPTKQ